MNDRDAIIDVKDALIEQMTNENTSLRAQVMKPKQRNPWFASETISNNSEVTTTAMCIKVDAVCNLEENDTCKDGYLEKYLCHYWKAGMTETV